ncbi:MAG: hypothetical protein ACYC4R_05300 [Anaerolineae bacterium]
MPQKLQEAIDISDKVLAGIETQQISASTAALMCLRIARLLSDSSSVRWLQYEVAGYPPGRDGILASETFTIAAEHGRQSGWGDKPSVTTVPASVLEAAIENYRQHGPTVTTQGVSLSGEHLYIAMRELSQTAAAREDGRSTAIGDYTQLLEKLRAQYYEYALKVNMELRFSAKVESVFNGFRTAVDQQFLSLAPNSIKKLDAVYEDLASDNPESWHEALASCRRLIAEISDALFLEWHEQPGTEDKYKVASGREMLIGGDHYINRLYATLDHLGLGTTAHRMIGSQIKYASDLIENIYKEVCLGVHALETLEYDDAEAAVLHTYILLGNLARLGVEKTKSNPKSIMPDE